MLYKRLGYKVLIAGSTSTGETSGPDIAELFDPVTLKTVNVYSLPHSRLGGRIAVNLSDHSVLIIWGNADKYVGNYSNGAWLPAGELPDEGPGFNLAGALLNNGKVLISGGSNLKSVRTFSG